MKKEKEQEKDELCIDYIDYSICQVCGGEDKTKYGLCDQCCEDMGSRMLERLGPNFFKM